MIKTVNCSSSHFAAMPGFGSMSTDATDARIAPLSGDTSRPGMPNSAIFTAVSVQVSPLFNHFARIQKKMLQSDYVCACV